MKLLVIISILLIISCCVTENLETSSFGDISRGASKYYGRTANIMINDPVKKHKLKHHKCPPKRPQDRCIDEKVVDCSKVMSKCPIELHPDINKFILKTQMPICPNMNDYIHKDKIPPYPDMNKYIRKDKIPSYPNMKNYIRKDKIQPNNCPNLKDYVKKNKIKPCNKCPTCPKCPQYNNLYNMKHPMRYCVNVKNNIDNDYYKRGANNFNEVNKIFSETSVKNNVLT